MNNKKAKGIVLALSGGIFWGFSGVCGQYLFRVKDVMPQWLTSWRLFFAGLFMLIFSVLKYGTDIFKAFSAKNILHMLVFTVVGVVMCQYLYFTAISLSNSATATVLQYISPAVVMLFTCMAYKKAPSLKQLAALFCTMAGVFFIAAGGKLSSLSISSGALSAGLFSGICYAVYTIESPSLSDKCGLLPLLGWSNFLGSLPMLFINRHYAFAYKPDAEAALVFAAIVILGTVISFGIFTEGCRLAGAVTASMCAGIEPLASAVISFLWMGTHFSCADAAGMIFIVAAVIMLSLEGGGAKDNKASVRHNAQSGL